MVAAEMTFILEFTYPPFKNPLKGPFIKKMSSPNISVLQWVDTFLECKDIVSELVYQQFLTDGENILQK